MAHGGRKTYLPTLVRILARLCQYIIRYRATIVEYLPEGQESKLTAVLVACEALLAVIDLAEAGG